MHEDFDLSHPSLRHGSFGQASQARNKLKRHALYMRDKVAGLQDELAEQTGPRAGRSVHDVWKLVAIRGKQLASDTL